MRRKASLAAGLLLAALLCLPFLAACDMTPTPISPLPSPTPPDSPLPSPTSLLPPETLEPEIKVPVEERPDENERFRTLFRSASHARANWGAFWAIASTTHFHKLRFIRQLRRVDTGAVLLEVSVETNVLSVGEEPEPHNQFVAAWEYDLDLQAEYGVSEAEEWVKPVWVCVREPGEEEPCLCQINEGDELTDCTEMVGRCEGWAKHPEQAEDGFCFTNLYSDLPQLFPVYLPVIIVEIVTDP